MFRLFCRSFVRLFVRSFVVVCGLLVTGTPIAHAQVTFQWPETAVDVSKYTTVEQCLGLSKMNMQMARRLSPRFDTVAGRSAFVNKVWPPEVVTAAQRCAAKFTADNLLAGDTLQAGRMIDAFYLLLTTNRDADAVELARRWVNALPPGQDTLRTRALFRFARDGIGLGSFRFAMAWSLIGDVDLQQFWGYPMQIAYWTMKNARMVGDTIAATEAARWLARLPEVVGPDVTEEDNWQTGIGLLVLDAVTYLSNAELLDSLQKSTSAYNALLKTLRDRSAIRWSLNPQVAPPIEGEYWFPAKPEQPRPRRGVVSVVLTTGANDCGTCLGRIGMIRRLHTAFPDVEFTLLTRTRGFHGLVIEPPTPDQEAQLIDSVYRKRYQLPATIVVYKTPFWNLEAPDGRRMNEPGPNESAFPTLSLENSDRIYLIDRAGEIVFKNEWINTSEAQVGKVLDALLRQPQKTTTVGESHASSQTPANTLASPPDP